MRTLKTLSFALTVFLAATNAAADVISSFADSTGLVTTFNGNLTVGVPELNGNCIPFTCSVIPKPANVDYQQVYAATEFSGRTVISSLTFFFDPTGGGSGLVTAGSYSVYLSTTSAAVNGLDGTNLAANRGSNLTFFGTFAAGTSVNPEITISGVPFAYDPSKGNVLLEIFGTGTIQHRASGLYAAG